MDLCILQERSTKHAVNTLVTREDFRTKAIGVGLFRWLARLMTKGKPVLMAAY